MNFNPFKRPNSANETPPPAAPEAGTEAEGTPETIPETDESMFPPAEETETPELTHEEIFGAAIGKEPIDGDGEPETVEEIESIAEAPIEEETTETLPLAETPQPPKPLVAGAFLGGELEIVEVVSRGLVNFYRADAGDWGAHEWKLVTERESPLAEALDGPEALLFPAAKRFVQEGREYAVWDWSEEPIQPLRDWRAPANDEILLGLLQNLAAGLEALEVAGLKADFGDETLVLEDGALRYHGFFDAGSLDSLNILDRFARQIARGHLAPNATIRLDDEWGALPFSNEIKEFARRLNAGEWSSIGAVREWLAQFGPLEETRVAVASDVGMERDHNEDATASWRFHKASQDGETEIECLAVADGMGGHEAGEVASRVALDALEKALLSRKTLDWNENQVALTHTLQIIEEVNAAVVNLNNEPPFASMRHKPGTTLVFALRLGSRLVIGNVGDSRAYRWNAEKGLERLTKDHSYVQDLLDSGRITEEQAWGHPDGSIITSHIGMARGLIRDVFLRLLQNGDTLFLVSDGVVDTLRDASIAEIAAAHQKPRALCQALIEAANAAGGIDNISVAAMRCE